MKKPATAKTIIQTARGPREAVEPVIVSASRSTDIPAFYMPWLVNRFRAGYARWINPFNRAEQFVSFEKTRAIVFWSKNPRPLLDHAQAFERYGWYLTYTLNDSVREGLEPGLPPLAERIDTFRRFADLVGPERVIWRCDPLLLLDGLGVAPLLERIRVIASALQDRTRRLVFSFADITGYRKVQVNLNAAKIPWRDWDASTMIEAATGLASIGREFGLEVQTCAESIPLAHLGITRGRCIDGNLLHRLFPCDRDLRAFLGFGTCQAPLQPTLDAVLPDGTALPVDETGNPTPTAGATRRRKADQKDNGQRPDCGCCPSKDIGRYDTCPHGCLYCYANASPALATRNAARHDPTADSIMP